MSQLGESLIRFDSGRTHKQANQEAGVAGHAPGTCMFSGIKLKYFRSRCRSVTLPPFFFVFFCLFVDFSEQFVLTGKCHATLSALTPALPTTTATHCLPLSLSLYSHFSSCSFPSPLFTSYHILFFSPSLLCVSSPPPVRFGSTECATEHNVQHFTANI